MPRRQGQSSKGFPCCRNHVDRPEHGHTEVRARSRRRDVALRAWTLLDKHTGNGTELEIDTEYHSLKMGQRCTQWHGTLPAFFFKRQKKIIMAWVLFVFDFKNNANITFRDSSDRKKNRNNARPITQTSSLVTSEVCFISSAKYR